MYADCSFVGHAAALSRPSASNLKKTIGGLCCLISDYLSLLCVSVSLWWTLPSPFASRMINPLYSSYARMWTLRTLAIALAFSAGLALAQDPTEQQLPANPQPQKPPAVQPPPRTAPSSSAPQPSPPAEKPPAGADAQAQTAPVLPAAAERHYHAARMA